MNAIELQFIRVMGKEGAMDNQFPEEELDKIIREIIGAERKIIFETGNSATRRTKDIRAIIDRRAAEEAES